MDNNYQFTSPDFPSEQPQNPKWQIFSIVAIGLAIVFVAFWYVFINKKPENTNLSKEVSTTKSLLEISEWNTYKNDSFGYELQYPPDWTKNYSTVTSPDGKAKLDIVTKTCQTYNSSGQFKYESIDASTKVFVRNDCRNGMSVSLFVSGTENELHKYQPILEQILSTIKLSIGTDSWNTYKNDKLLFQFKYPSGFRLNEDNNFSSVYIRLEMFEAFPNKSDMTQTKDRWSPTNFIISAQSTSETTESLKDLEKDWEPTIFQGQNALLLVAGDFCDKKIVFVNNKVKYEITEPTSCSVPLDNRISKIYETFRVFDLDTELRSEIQNGKNYQNNQGGFGFKYPSSWNLYEGPITQETKLTPNTIIVRYTPKNLMSNTKEKCPETVDYTANSPLICEVVKINGTSISANLHLDYLYNSIAGKRFLEKNKTYFNDYVSMKDKSGNGILIDFLSTLSQDEASKIIKSILSTLNFK